MQAQELRGKKMSLHKYFKTKSTASVIETLATVIPVAATIAELTPNGQNEVAKAIKNIAGKRSRRLPTRSMSTSNEVKLRNLPFNRVTNQHHADLVFQKVLYVG